MYREFFARTDIQDVELPFENNGRHSYNQFVIKVSQKRNELRGYLADQGVGAEIYYPVPLHVQECFHCLGYRPEDCPVSVEAAEKTIALPIYPELRHEHLEYIVEKIRSFFNNKGAL